MGRDQDPCRSALSAPHSHRGAEILAVCREWRAPSLFGVEPPKPRIEAVRIVDMGAPILGRIRWHFYPHQDAHLEHEQAKAELKGLVPEDAQQAIGHGIRAKRSKSGAISLDLLKPEGESHAAVQ